MALLDDRSPRPEETASRTSPAAGPMTRGVHARRLVDAIYADLRDLGEWARAVLDALAVAVPSCARGSFEIAQHGSLLASASTGPSSTHEGSTLRARSSRHVGVTLVLAFAGRPALAACERTLLSRAELHLENSVRHRFTTSAPRLLVMSDELLGGDDGLWRKLVSGRASLVSRLGHPKPTYAVLEVAEPCRHRCLTGEEEAVLKLAARGLMGKYIAYELGRSQASVSLQLASAAAKIGVRSTFEVVQIASRLAVEATSGPGLGRLTGAEREIVGLLQAGLSNAEIARVRDRSLRTVANQVASVLRKTQSASRRAVGAAAWRGSRPPAPSLV